MRRTSQLVVLLVCVGTLTGSGHADVDPHYSPASTIACLIRHGYHVARLVPEHWLSPQPTVKAVWAAKNVPMALARDGLGTGLFFYRTADEAREAANGWQEQSRRALCATFGKQEQWCLEHVHREVQIPHETDGNVFLNFSATFEVTRAEQLQALTSLRRCAQTPAA